MEIPSNAVKTVSLTYHSEIIFSTVLYVRLTPWCMISTAKKDRRSGTDIVEKRPEIPGDCRDVSQVQLNFASLAQ